MRVQRQRISIKGSWKILLIGFFQFICKNLMFNSEGDGNGGKFVRLGCFLLEVFFIFLWFFGEIFCFFGNVLSY